MKGGFQPSIALINNSTFAVTPAFFPLSVIQFEML